jgi:hypothetical protein
LSRAVCRSGGEGELWREGIIMQMKERKNKSEEEEKEELDSMLEEA